MSAPTDKVWLGNVTRGRILSFLFCFSGLVGCFLLYGVLQERLMSFPYGVEQEHFDSSAFPVLINRIVTSISTAVIILCLRDTFTPACRITEFCKISLFNVCGTVLQYEALKYVSFPTTTLIKCGKMIPVLIWGTLLGHKRHYEIAKMAKLLNSKRFRYALHEYVVSLLVTAGAAGFLLSGNVSGRAGQGDSKMGVLLVVLFLTLDGLQSTTQEKIFKEHKMSVVHQLFWVNTISALGILFVGFASGYLEPPIQFAIKHPEVLLYSGMLSLCSMGGQFFITHTIKEFGALAFSAIMTTRLFLSILLSCLLYVHYLTPLQWLCTGVVFGALYYKVSVGAHSSQAEKPRP